MTQAMKRPANESATESETPSKASRSSELTAAALRQHNLDDKINQLQKGMITDDTMWDAMTPKDRYCAWKRFEHARGKSPDAQSHWENINECGRGQNKGYKKRMLLMAFLREGKFGEHYFKTYDTMTVSRSSEELLQWVPWAECQRYYGQDEAKARVASRSIAVRKCPQDNRFFQFLLVKDESKMTTEQKRILETSRNAKLNAKEYKALADGIMSNHDEGFLGNLLTTAEFGKCGDISFKDLMDNQGNADEEGNAQGIESGMEAGLKELIEGGNKQISTPKQTQAAPKPRPRSQQLDTKLDKLSEVGDRTSKTQAIKRCNQMHGILAKVLLKLQARGSRDLNETDKQEYDALVGALKKNQEEMEKIVVDQENSSLETIKAALVTTAKNVKIAYKMTSPADNAQ